MPDDTATQAVFACGWIHSGDLAVEHPDGYIEVRGRAKDIIISGGESVSSVEVESVLLSHPDILDAAVVARRNDEWDEVLCAFGLLKPGSDISSAEIITFCRSKLPAFRAPKTAIFMEAPKTATGKVKENYLRKMTNGRIEWEGARYCSHSCDRGYLTRSDRS